MSRKGGDREQSPRSPLVLGVLASGRGSNLQSILEAIERGELFARIGVVISNKKEAPALEHAKRSGIPAFFIDPSTCPDRREYDRVILQKLKEYRIDWVVLAGYMRLVSSILIEPFRNRIINIHPSLLPSFPGLHAHRQALEYGVRISGCTIHLVDEKMDHGPIIAQAAVPVLEGDTEEQLSERILVEEHRLLPRVLQWCAEGELRGEGRKIRLDSERGAL